MLMGGTATIQGRVEAPDPGAGKGNGAAVPNQDQIVQHPRIGATFVVTNGHGGRFSGTKDDLQ